MNSISIAVCFLSLPPFILRWDYQNNWTRKNSNRTSESRAREREGKTRTIYVFIFVRAEFSFFSSVSFFTSISSPFYQRAPATKRRCCCCCSYDYDYDDDYEQRYSSLSSLEQLRNMIIGIFCASAFDLPNRSECTRDRGKVSMNTRSMDINSLRSLFFLLTSTDADASHIYWNKHTKYLRRCPKS